MQLNSLHISRSYIQCHVSSARDENVPKRQQKPVFPAKHPIKNTPKKLFSKDKKKKKKTSYVTVEKQEEEESSRLLRVSFVTPHQTIFFLFLGL